MSQSLTRIGMVDGLAGVAMMRAIRRAGVELVPVDPRPLPFRPPVNTLTAADQDRIEQAWERRKRRAAKRADSMTQRKPMGDET